MKKIKRMFRRLLLSLLTSSAMVSAYLLHPSVGHDPVMLLSNKFLIINAVLSAFMFFIFSISIEKGKGPKLISRAKKQQSFKNIKWEEFEILTEEYFKRKGFRSIKTGCNGGGGDGGIDVRLKRSGKSWVVQCKHWKNNVGIKAVREMYGIMHHEKADGVKIVSSSGFTKECYKYVIGKPIQLITGEQLLSEI